MWKDGLSDEEWEASVKKCEGVGNEGEREKYRLMSLYFASVNRNKKSVTVDLKSDEGKGLIRRLITEWPASPSDPDGYSGADVVVHNFLPGKIEKMGLGYEEVSKWNPRLIYASVSGYGSTGPMRTRAGYDAIALAESGLLHITGETREGAEPVKPGVAIGDLCTGLYVHGAILAALQERHRTGRGGRVEGSLLESSMSLMINVGLGAMNLDLGEKRRRGKKLGMGHASLCPYGGYETRDGRWFFVAANNNRQWQGFCAKLGADDLAAEEKFKSNDGRVEDRDELNSRLSEVFKQKTLKEWKEIFEGSGLPYGAVNDVVEALEMEQSVDRGMIREIEGLDASRSGTLKVLGSAVKFGNYPRQASEAQRRDGKLGIGDVRILPPLLGAHTDEVLTEVLGMGEKERAGLREKGVV
jgi:succinate---hydroxymethylglutarate CoA-transferase